MRLQVVKLEAALRAVKLDRPKADQQPVQEMLDGKALGK